MNVRPDRRQHFSRRLAAGAALLYAPRARLGAVPHAGGRVVSVRRWSSSGRRRDWGPRPQRRAPGTARLEKRPIAGGRGMNSGNGHSTSQPHSPPKTADIVILGAGVMGASIAFHLAKRRAGAIVVLDKDHVGRGGSGRSSALVRMHYSFPAEVQLALVSLQMFQNWQEIVGAPGDFRKTGFVRIVHPNETERLKQNVEMQRGLGAK